MNYFSMREAGVKSFSSSFRFFYYFSLFAGTLSMLATCLFLPEIVHPHEPISAHLSVWLILELAWVIVGWSFPIIVKNYSSRRLKRWAILIPLGLSFSAFAKLACSALYIGI